MPRGEGTQEAHPDRYASGQLDRLLRSGARCVRQAMVLDAGRTGEVPSTALRPIGPALLFERSSGCGSRLAGTA